MPDPYYGGEQGFEEVLAMVERTCAGLVVRPPAAAGLRTVPSRHVTRQPVIAKHAEELLGSAVVATAPLAGGDTSAATKLRLSDGTTAIMKTHAHPPAGFFAAEAARAALARRGRRRRRRARA